MRRRSALWAPYGHLLADPSAESGALLANTGRGGWRRIKWSEVEATIAGLGAPGDDAVVADAVQSRRRDFDVVVAALD